MPQFDFSEYGPQTQAGALTGPRDQGTGIRMQTQQQLAAGLSGIVGDIDQIGRQRVQEQAKSDMGAFQAELIRRESEFSRQAQTINNPEDYQKAVDKYVKDLNKYASGKRADGTPVFRNGLGKADYKNFSQEYIAKFKADGAQKSFELDRKRDRLNYQMAINSGVENRNPEAITQSYQALVDDGHLTQEEATIEKDKAMTAMSINYFKETQAKMMLGVEEALETSTDLKATGEMVKGAFATYKAELYNDDNLGEQERLALLNNAKSSLRLLEATKKAERSAREQQAKNLEANLHSQYLRDIATNPGMISQIGKQYLIEHPNLSKETLNKITTASLESHEKFQAAQKNEVDRYFQTFKDSSIRSKILKTKINTPEDYNKAIDQVAQIGDPTLKSQTLKWIEEQAPGKEAKDPMLINSMAALTTGVEQALGLDMTRAQIEKLDKDVQFGGSRPDWIPETSLEVYVGGLSTPQRQMWARKIEDEYLRLYNEKGKTEADEYAKDQLKEINSVEAKYELYSKKFRKPLTRPKR